jgi:transcriptional regulator with XRE-family HTH domain
MPNVHKTLSENVRQLLHERQMTAEQLARSLDIGKSHMSRVLNQQKKASLDLVQEMAICLGVDVADLLTTKKRSK